MGMIKDGKQLPLENVLAGIVPTVTNGTDAPIEYAFLDDGGVFTDETTDANSAAAADVTLMPAVEAVNDAFYFGSAETFGYIKINFSTAGVGGVIAWEYWNGTWTAISGISDGTVGLTAGIGNYTVIFGIPTDWATTTVNSQLAYWVRFRVTNPSFSVVPVATQIWLDGTANANLAKATDGNNTTKTDTMTGVVASGVTFGEFNFDLGSNKTVLVCGKIGIWGSTTSNVGPKIETSSDGATYQSINSAGANVVGSLTEQIIDIYPVVINNRYFRIRCTTGATMTGYTRLYEIKAYQLE